MFKKALVYTIALLILAGNTAIPVFSAGIKISAVPEVSASAPAARVNGALFIQISKDMAKACNEVFKSLHVGLILFSPVSKQEASIGQNAENVVSLSFAKDVLFVKTKKAGTAGRLAEMFSMNPLSAAGKINELAGFIIVLMMLFLYALYRGSIPNNGLRIKAT